MNPNRRGRLITLEGGEGVGKSTNLALIETLLRDRGLDVCVTREPGGTPLGEALRSMLLSAEHAGPVPLAELLMMFAARAQHIATVIEPALARGQWVLCDRFTDATYAYQGYGRGLDLEAIATLERLVQGDLRPELTVLLDVDPGIGLARAEARGDLDRFELESERFFARVRAGYLERADADPGRWCVIDAGQPLETVQSDLRGRMENWLDDIDECI